MRDDWWRVLPAYVLGVLLGALLAVVGAFLVPVEPVRPVSVGVLVAVAGNLLVPYHLGRAAGSVAGAVVPAAVWLLVAVRLGTSRAEGDLVVTGSAGGLAFLVLGALAAALSIRRVRPALLRDARRAAPPREPTAANPDGPDEPAAGQV